MVKIVKLIENDFAIPKSLSYSVKDHFICVEKTEKMHATIESFVINKAIITFKVSNRQYEIIRQETDFKKRSF